MPTLKKYCVSSSNKRRVLRDRDTSEALQSLALWSWSSHVGWPATRFVSSENQLTSVAKIHCLWRNIGQLKNLEQRPVPCHQAGRPTRRTNDYIKVVLIPKNFCWQYDKYFRWKLRWEMPFRVADEAARGKEHVNSRNVCVGKRQGELLTTICGSDAKNSHFKIP